MLNPTRILNNKLLKSLFLSDEERFGLARVDAKFWAHSIYSSFMQHPITSLSISRVVYRLRPVSQSIPMRNTSFLEYIPVERLGFFGQPWIGPASIPVVWCYKERSPSMKVQGYLDIRKLL